MKKIRLRNHTLRMRDESGEMFSFLPGLYAVPDEMPEKIADFAVHNGFGFIVAEPHPAETQDYKGAPSVKRGKKAKQSA